MEWRLSKVLRSDGADTADIHDVSNTAASRLAMLGQMTNLRPHHQMLAKFGNL